MFSQQWHKYTGFLIIGVAWFTAGFLRTANLEETARFLLLPALIFAFALLYESAVLDPARRAWRCIRGDERNL